MAPSLHTGNPSPRKPPDAVARFPDLERLQVSLQTLRAAIQSPHGAFLVAAETETRLPAAQSPLEQAIEASQHGRKPGHEQPFALRQTCPICAAQSQAVFDFFAHWQYAVSRDEGARRAHRAARGFCRVHTWLFQQIAAPQGINLAYTPLVEAAAAELRLLIGRPPRECAAGVDGLLPTTESCGACRLLRKTGRAQMTQFLALMATAEGQERFRQSQGLCLPHLKDALLSSPAQEVADVLLQEQANRLVELSEDMHSYSLKRDAIRRQLMNNNEENAWRRALVQIVGERTAHVE